MKPDAVIVFFAVSFFDNNLLSGDYRFGKTLTHIRVPDSGVYIMKTGYVFRKILIP